MVKVAYNSYATFFLPVLVPQGGMLTIGSVSCQIFYNKKKPPLRTALKKESSFIPL